MSLYGYNVVSVNKLVSLGIYYQFWVIPYTPLGLGMWFLLTNTWQLSGSSRLHSCQGVVAS